MSTTLDETQGRLRSGIRHFGEASRRLESEVRPSLPPFDPDRYVSRSRADPNRLPSCFATDSLLESPLLEQAHSTPIPAHARHITTRTARAD